MNLESIKASFRKYPIGWISGLLTLILIGFGVFRYQTYQEAVSEAEAKSTEGQRLDTNVSYSANLVQQVEQLTAANEIIASRLVKSNELAINLQYFYKLVAETDVKLVDLRQLESTALKTGKTNYSTVAYMIKMQGKLPKALLFLRRIEQGTYYTRILSADISMLSQRGQDDSAEGTGGQIELTLGIEVLGKPI
jgi:hypothetical protein